MYFYSFAQEIFCAHIQICAKQFDKMQSEESIRSSKWSKGKNSNKNWEVKKEKKKKKPTKTMNIRQRKP